MCWFSNKYKIVPIDALETCTICLDPIGKNKCRLDCGHEFHVKCILQWVGTSNNTCPICRQKIQDQKTLFLVVQLIS